MPRRNIIKLNVPDSYYHVYARGNNKQSIFLDPKDYLYFINLFRRYLSSEPSKDKLGTLYPHLCKDIELVTYCLMGNHFHLLVYQKTLGAMGKLMKSVMSSYCQYFNLKYGRTGGLFESTYKASLVRSEIYLLHISRYIHLNPRYWRNYPYSSIGVYLDNQEVDWMSCVRIMELFSDKDEYELFLRDYSDRRILSSALKGELANT